LAIIDDYKSFKRGPLLSPAMLTEVEESRRRDKSLLRLGGLAGILAGISFILTIVILLGFVPTAPTTTVGPVMRWPDVRLAITAGDAIYLVGDMLWIAFFVALYRALRGTSLAPALFGGALGLVGVIVQLVGGLPPVVFGRISDLYHASGTSPVDQATLGLLWQAAQSSFNETDTVAFILWNVGFILLGIAMLKAPAFGKVFGAVGLLLGLAGVTGISLFAIDSVSFAPFGILAFIIFPILFGWKVYTLSRAA